MDNLSIYSNIYVHEDNLDMVEFKDMGGNLEIALRKQGGSAFINAPKEWWMKLSEALLMEIAFKPKTRVEKMFEEMFPDKAEAEKAKKETARSGPVKK